MMAEPPAEALPVPAVRSAAAETTAVLKNRRLGIDSASCRRIGATNSPTLMQIFSALLSILPPGYDFALINF
jgi:hypothetical protein